MRKVTRKKVRVIRNTKRMMNRLADRQLLLRDLLEDVRIQMPLEDASEMARAYSNGETLVFQLIPFSKVEGCDASFTYGHGRDVVVTGKCFTFPGLPGSTQPN